MPLTPEEEKELTSLEGGSLSPDEEAELASLEGRTLSQKPVSHVDSLMELLGKPAAPTVPKNKEEWMDRAHTAANVLPLALGPAGALARIGVGAAAGAAENATNRNDPRSLLERSTMGALRGGTIGAGGELVAKGAGKAADWAMQKAVGIKKYIPGVGNTLVDEGMVGTKNMMAGQAESRLAAAENELQNAAASIPGTRPTNQLADAATQRGNKLVTPNSGITLPTVQGDLDKANDLAGWLRKQQPQTARDMVSLKRQGDWGSFTKAGDQATSMDADLGVAVANAARGELADMSKGLQTTIPDILKREQALTLAKKALERPETIPQGVVPSIFAKLPGSSLVGSAGAQATQKVGNASKSSTLQALLRMLSGQ